MLRLTITILTLAALGPALAGGPDPHDDGPVPQPPGRVTVEIEDKRKTMMRHMAGVLYKRTGFGYDGPIAVTWKETKHADGVVFMVERILPVPGMFAGCDSSTEQGCNQTAEDYGICDDHGGVNEGLTEVGPDGWCWITCDDGALSGISCTDTIIDEPEPIDNDEPSAFCDQSNPLFNAVLCLTEVGP